MYFQVFSGINGLLIPGGATSIAHSGYADASNAFFKMAKEVFYNIFCIFNPTPPCRQTWQETFSQFGELVSDLRWWCWWLTRASHTEQRECSSAKRSHLIDSSLKNAKFKANCFHCHKQAFKSQLRLVDLVKLRCNSTEQALPLELEAGWEESRLLGGASNEVFFRSKNILK